MQNPTAIARLAEEVQRLFPDLDVLLKNAGIFRLERWDRDAIEIDTSLSIIETNILGALRLAAALLPHSRGSRTRPSSPQHRVSPSYRASTIPPVAQARRFSIPGCNPCVISCGHKPLEVIKLPPPYVQTELAGSQQANDPAAMPLADYIAEIIRLLGEPTPASGEILGSSTSRLCAWRSGTTPIRKSTQI